MNARSDGQRKVWRGDFKLPHTISDRPDGSVEMNGFIFDRDWAEMLSCIHFHKSKQGYARVSAKNGGVEYLHRVITDCPKSMYVDHINRNTLDNRKINLRIVTCTVNARNKSNSKNSGVYQSKNRKFYARVSVRRKIVQIGTFSTREAAQEAKNAYEKLVEAERWKK